MAFQNLFIILGVFLSCGFLFPQPVLASDAPVSRGGDYLFFPLQDVKTVLHALALQHDLDVVFPSSLSGQVTLKTKSQTWEEVFTEILTPLGYSWSKSKSGFVVVSLVDSSPHFYFLNFITPASAVSALKDFKQSSEVVVPASGGVEIYCSDARARVFSNLLRSFDSRKRQVLVQCRFQSVSKSLSKSLGLDFSGVTNPTLSLQSLTREVSSSAGWGGTLSSTDFSLVLSALEKDLGSKALSKPSLLCLDNEQAVVKVGEQYPLPQYTYDSDSKTFQISGFDYKDIGISLSVTPSFVSDSLCQLIIVPEVSSVSNTVTYNSTATVPVIETKKLTTVAQIRDGQTVVLSGLIENSTGVASSRVPFWGRLPFLGRFFTSSDDSSSNSELIIFLTVKFL